MPKSVDLAISAGWIIPVRPAQVFERHSIVINQGKILAIVPTETVEKKYDIKEHQQLPNHLLMPGLVNTHTHAAMSLFKGIADDLALSEWLEKHIWPREAQWLSEEFVSTGTKLALAEMIRSGTTTFNDMYLFPDITAKHTCEAGLRAMIGLPIMEFPTAWAQDVQEYIHKGLSVHDEYEHIPSITTALAPHAPYTVSDESFTKVVTLAHELDMHIHTHIHETAFEVSESLKLHGERPLQRLHKLGVLSPNLIAVHMTQLTDAEIELLAIEKVSVAHCPESNLKLASGIAPIAQLLKNGVNVGIGTDGSASNNDLDLFTEIRTAALLAKGTNADAEVLSAQQAIEMATINGAKTLGMEKQIGSLEKNKQADIIAINVDNIEMQPLYNPLSQVVYSGSGHLVDHSWVAGKQIMRNRQLLTLEEKALLKDVKKWQLKIGGEHES